MSEERDRDAIAGFVDEIVGDLLNTSDEELREEMIAQYGGVSIAIGGMQTEIESAMNSLKKDRLVEARIAVAKAKEDSSTTQVDPATRQRLFELLSSNPKDIAMTLAARKNQGASEKDILSACTDLCELYQCKHTAPRPHFGNSPKAEQILKSLGITRPDEIDVEAIAWSLGARVKYEKLNHCEARIVGTNDSAIIAVDQNTSKGRQRFSICHELGHWIYHRKRILLCSGDEIERPSAESNSLERAADRFASELLMPTYLFAPLVESFGRPSMHLVQKLAGIFNTSQTATAIRLVEMSREPIVLACYGRGGRRWFARSQTVKRNWLPNNNLSAETSTFNMLHRNTPQIMPPKSMSATAWFGRWDASRFELIEETFRVGSAEVLTFLSFKDAPAFLRYSEQA